MISAEAFLNAAALRGFDFYTGVPCSFLTSLINRVISRSEMRYVGATSEGEAVAIAAGAWLAGRNTVVMCQNSGLGNAVNPLTSLNAPFRIPTLLITTWRGQPTVSDEPQHEVMGRITGALLDTLGVPHRPFPRAQSAIATALDEAEATMAKRSLPFALVMEKGALAEENLDEAGYARGPATVCDDLRRHGLVPARIDALKQVLASVSSETAVIATTGKCGRELFTLADRPQHFYLVGAMGCASALGLGVALNSARQILVLDGDGAALMKLGNMATIGAKRPGNLVHVVLDNGTHDSTGGQATVSPAVDFAAVALGCGYASVAACDDLGGFAKAMDKALAPGAPAGPHFIHLRIAPGSIKNLGRPTIPPHEVARRFRAFLSGA